MLRRDGGTGDLDPPTGRKWYSWNLNPDISNAKAVGHFMVYGLRNFPRITQRNTEIQFSTPSW